MVWKVVVEVGCDLVVFKCIVSVLSYVIDDL